jgi:hypothetical protein
MPVLYKDRQCLLINQEASHHLEKTVPSGTIAGFQKVSSKGGQETIISGGDYEISTFVSVLSVGAQ